MNINHNDLIENQEDEEEEEADKPEPSQVSKKPQKKIGPNLNLFDRTKCQDIYYEIKVDK